MFVVIITVIVVAFTARILALLAIALASTDDT